ncbi:TPA: SLATT domain-containing protein [Citrobacter freundii]|nr:MULTISPECIES: SLATT domain-containing protein [Citrobacter]EKW4402652.1 SLATT domain-containing protein [Citrobacter freundii]EKX8776214.1 SLATT domain-containing protein [Citrobacter freundii]ELF4150872.1 SLATT domain-containing protein [Citrobacter freundii]ELI8781974.1 SLATT domain-containing protein [Citrobacter freundii]ELJ5792887.1 SLATT domain-containing protein [Citrobacter freundii]
MNTSLAILRKRMKSTAYARFFSARRYDALNNYSLFSLSISSFCLIFITLLQKYSIKPIFSSENLELIQLLASITIATLSIVVSFASYAIKSEKMRVSGEEINELISKIDHLSDIPQSYKSIKKTKKIRVQYEILKSKSMNHKNFEFEYGKLERKREESESKEKCNCKNKVSFKSIFDNYSVYIPYISISFFSISFLLIGAIRYFILLG